MDKTPLRELILVAGTNRWDILMRSISMLTALLLAGCAPQLEPKPAVTTSPAMAVQTDQLLEDVRILSADDMQGRFIGSPGGAKARAYLLGRLNQIGVSPLAGAGLEWPFPAKREGQPVIATDLIGVIPGTGGSDRALILTAHYDHLGVRDGQIYNGADDNASGVAGILKIAASLKQNAPLHDVIVTLVDGEEGGMSGSRAMLANPKFAETLKRIVLAVNLDMVSRSDKNELYVSGGYHFPWLKPRLEALAKAASVTLLLGHDRPDQCHDDWTNQSDHYAFQLIHRPWVYFGVEDHADYHHPTDDSERIPADFFHRSVDTIELAVRAFDQDLAAISDEANGAPPR